MKNSIKAALFSALVCPGLGHFVLKRTARGMIFFVPSMLVLGYLVKNILLLTTRITEKIVNGAVSADIDTITALVTKAVADSPGLSIASYVLMALWVAAIVDSYLIGAQIDKAANPSS